MNLELEKKRGLGMLAENKKNLEYKSIEISI